MIVIKRLCFSNWCEGFDSYACGWNSNLPKTETLLAQDSNFQVSSRKIKSQFTWLWIYVGRQQSGKYEKNFKKGLHSYVKILEITQKLQNTEPLNFWFSRTTRKYLCTDILSKITVLLWNRIRRRTISTKVLARLQTNPFSHARKNTLETFFRNQEKCCAWKFLLSARDNCWLTFSNTALKCNLYMHRIMPLDNLTFWDRAKKNKKLSTKLSGVFPI